MAEDQNEKDIKEIQLLQYENLRHFFNLNIVNKILGKDYYNMGQCAYSCDRLTTEDVVYKFERLAAEKDFYMLGFHILIVVVVIMFIILVSLIRIIL